ncbi:hypothetical protein PWG71_12040 [Nocardiopsis sp. N85]|uniref:hypothetical protein n=1 Tax=Nocardiopsis sp. N85 TaxID=3029400 RepID=UPI00237F06CE|nr:hypothetical protein [Nocardiopsis sp. N85]MDE3722122.1 hypothetical protein [Nocardiopsis sp. N85]
MQTEAPPRPAHRPPAPFNERLHSSLYFVVAGVFFLPVVPVAAAAAIVVPWFASRHGRIVNGTPWLDAPLTDLLPTWVFWAAGVAGACVAVVSWGVAVHLLAQALHGRPVRLGRALARSLTRFPLTLAAAAVTAGVLWAADAALLAAYDQAHPALRFSVGAALFASLTPLWAPLAGIHTQERPLAFLAGLRGRGLLTGSGGADQWGSVSAVAGCAAVVAYLGSGITTENTLIPTLIAGLAGLFVAALALTLAVTGGGPAPQERPRRPYLAAVMVVVVVMGLAVPVRIYQHLLTGGPWPTLRYETVSLAAWGRVETNPQPLLLPEDEASVVFGDREVLCGEGDRCVDLETPQDDVGALLTTTGMAGNAVRTVYTSREVWKPQGTIVLHDQCLDATDCASGTWTIEPPVEPEGRWNTTEEDPAEQITTSRLSQHMAAWGGVGGGRHLVVTATPSVGYPDTLLTLSSCSTDHCRNQASTLLVREPGSAFASTDWSRHTYPALVSVTATDQGVGRVSVHHPDTGALTLYACHDVECADFTTTELLAPSGVPRTMEWNPERYTGATVRIRPDGTPVIVHLDTRDGSVRLIDCADAVCSEHDTAQVLGPGWQRTPPALALDSAGLPQIATIDTTTREVLYLACADARCQDYDRTVVGVYDYTPGWIDLALDGDDRPHLVWHRVVDDEEHTYELVRCATAHCAR